MRPNQFSSNYNDVQYYTLMLIKCSITSFDTIQTFEGSMLNSKLLIFVLLPIKIVQALDSWTIVVNTQLNSVYKICACMLKIKNWHYQWDLCVDQIKIWSLKVCCLVDGMQKLLTWVFIWIIANFCHF